VPSTLIGLVVFVISLAPGLVFVVTRQRVAPQPDMSVLQETAELVCVSLLLDVVVLGGFGIVRALFPGATPDVGQLVRHTDDYLHTSYLRVALWGLALLAIAVVLAALAGAGLARKAIARIPGVRLNPATTPHESASSAWWLLFAEEPNRRVHVGCNLEDGSFVSGWLASYNTTISETADRDLTLAAPISYRAKGVADATELAGTSAVVVSARKITLLFVSYQNDGQ
jgi:hypothetical protein